MKTTKSEIFNIDCLEGMKQFPNNYFDLAIVDPPYGINESSKNRNGITKVKDKRNGRVSFVKTNNEIKDWDEFPPNKDYFIELKRVSKNQIIFGANHFIENIPNANSSSWFVWDKCNGDSDFADCELAYTSFKSAVRQFRYMWSGMYQGKQSFKDGHIFEGNLSLHEKRIHKTHKPIIIYKWLLTNYAKEGDKILDTHIGSGSSRIAAYDLGFDFTGFELDEDYFIASDKRFKQHISQLTIF
jgi:site-specific DNA-methyltransferase (adenine-specific)